MIRKFQLKCNLIHVKSSTKSLFELFMKSFRPEREICPFCGRTGDCSVFAYYDRYVIDFIKGKPVTSSIMISRVRCSCGHTHAILPDPIIPYDSYSLFFILRVLMEYSLRIRTVSELCDRFCITLTTLYRWKKLYREHRLEWQGLLKTIEQSMLASIKELICIDPYCDLAESFFRKTGLSFLQSHRNPSYCKRSSKSPDP